MKKMIIGACLFLCGFTLLCASTVKFEIMGALSQTAAASRGIENPISCALMTAGITFMAYGYREK